MLEMRLSSKNTLNTFTIIICLSFIFGSSRDPHGALISKESNIL